MNEQRSYHFKPNPNLPTHYTSELRNHDKFSYGGGAQRGHRLGQNYQQAYAQPRFQKQQQQRDSRGDYQGQKRTQSFDDFLELGNSFDNCLEKLRSVMIRCEKTNLMLNWEKCHFMVQEGIVLGHRISARGIEVDKAKIEAIEKLPPPSSVKSIRSFLRHARFYRRFITDFSRIAKPLSSLLVQGTPFDFDEQSMQAF